MKALVEYFNREKTDYAITGAIAASYYGIPRTTLDADFIVHIFPREINKFFQGIQATGVRVDLQKIRRQLKSGYNVMTVADRLSPHTADLILVKEPPERKKGTVQGVKTYFQSPESLILAKLRMIKATIPRERSLTDRDDIRAILANTKVSRRRIMEKARLETTLAIFQQLTRPEPPA